MAPRSIVPWLPLAALLCVGHARANDHEIALRATASVSADVVTLGDVARLDSQRDAGLAARPVANAPRVGQVLVLERAQVDAALPAGWHAVGAAVVHVERATQDVAAERLCEEALAGARARLASVAPSAHAGITCLDARLPTLRLPAGALALRTDASAFEPVSGMGVLRVEILVSGRLQRSVGVPLRVDLDIGRWCASAALPEGTPLGAASFARCERPVHHARDLALASQPLPEGRLRRALRAGDVLAAADVSAPDEALAGDPVTVRLHGGGIELESAGVLVQSARIGARVHVRTAATATPVVGNLTDRSVVELE